MITQVEIAKILQVDVSTVNKILNRKPGIKFRKETVERVFRLARQNKYDFRRLKFRHRRSHERRNINRSARVEVRLGDGKVFDRGRAVLRDLSLGGARLGEISLDGRSLPVEPFKFDINLDGIQLQAMPVRFIQNGRLDIGIAFVEFQGQAKRRLKKLLSDPQD